MHVTYCDLCSQPLKDGNLCMLYIAEPRNINYEKLDYYSYLNNIEKSAKEICPSCKHIFDRMFELRLHRLCELAEEINLTYNLPSKKNPKERKNEKEKK
jgi:hypothetical protein